MKFIAKLCLFGILLFAVASCNKDENNINIDHMVGEWRMTDIHSDDGVSETVILGQTVNGTYTFHGSNYNTFTTFTENPNEFSSTGSYVVLTALTAQGQTQNSSVNVNAFPGTGTWSINGDKLTQNFLGTTSTYDILELSDSKLRLKGIVDETIQDSTLGIIIHDRATVFSTFEKQ